MSIRKREKSYFFRIVIIPERLTRQQKRQKKAEKVGKRQKKEDSGCCVPTAAKVLFPFIVRRLSPDKI